MINDTTSPQRRRCGRHPRGLLAIVLATALSWASAVAAQEVQLKTKDGSFEIKGELISVEDGFMTVRTSVGQIRIPVADVSCEGLACPEEAGATAAQQGEATATAGSGDATDLTVSLAAGLPRDLIDRLAAAYAGSDGVAVTEDGRSWTIDSPSGSFRLTIGDAGSDLIIETTDNPTAADVRQVLAFDAIVAVATPANRPTSLSLEDLSRIYSGRFVTWSELKVRGGSIVPALPESDPAVDEFVRGRLLGNALPATSIVRADNIPGFLLATPGSIALVRASSRGPLKATPLSGSCGLSVDLGAFTVKSGQYPLVRSVVVRAGTDALAAPVQAFFDFAGTDIGQAAMAEAGLVDQSIMRASREWQSDWIASAAKFAEFDGSAAATRALQDLVGTISGASRLSLTFRYVHEKSEPGAADQSDFARLAAAIDSGAYDHNEILFLGYSDGVSVGGRSASSAAANRVMTDFLSANQALLNLPNIKFSATGFGGIAPLLCSGSPVEQAVNRRIEVWIRPL